MQGAVHTAFTSTSFQTMSGFLPPAGRDRRQHRCAASGRRAGGCAWRLTQLHGHILDCVRRRLEDDLAHGGGAGEGDLRPQCLGPQGQAGQQMRWVAGSGLPSSRTLSTSGCCTRAAPDSPGPVMTLITPAQVPCQMRVRDWQAARLAPVPGLGRAPGGKPASVASCARRRPDSGVCSATCTCAGRVQPSLCAQGSSTRQQACCRRRTGRVTLSTEVQPHAKDGASFQVGCGRQAGVSSAHT